MKHLQHLRKCLCVAPIVVVGLAIAGLAYAANARIQNIEVEGETLLVKATGLGNIAKAGGDLSLQVEATGDIFTICRNPSGREVEAQNSFDEDFTFDIDEKTIDRNGNFMDSFNIAPEEQNPCPNGRWTATTTVVELDRVEVKLLLNGDEENPLDTEVCIVEDGECV